VKGKHMPFVLTPEWIAEEKGFSEGRRNGIILGRLTEVTGEREKPESVAPSVFPLKPESLVTALEKKILEKNMRKPWADRKMADRKIRKRIGQR